MAQDYQELVVWQKAVELTVLVYKLTQSFPQSELYGLSSQMRRAAVSIASNIAEGRGRINSAEFVSSWEWLEVRPASCQRNYTSLGLSVLHRRVF